ncbi:SGNH/GDSL hydrolase family protein [Lusitaniella coriacea LEGE 07157]|uniref:SGNH/GDSL hydrolase family protein n=1 Tax=Lusitaniella coriacea LEGE 07157 TaxID=945747 RepID=A0A8J7E025_9CYAN|nr:SGNH/GDSL hydrolase family protein [Lusitaniella coriacea]MBE9118884.1 SGNH/GDSL hydrolase family protein [Lusitaniella coriacea LEGE 07157]
MRYPAKYWIPVVLLSLPIASELILRWGLGFGNPPLLQADSEMGYRFQGNQKIERLGKRIEYNQYSQRSEPMSREKEEGTLRILMTGDSVLNGGNPIDQKETISELLEAKLSHSGQRVEVLNASAGSWGIGNQLGYLRAFGTLDSDVLIVQIGTHDLTQPTSTRDRVGTDPNYPNRAPTLALQELFVRYLLPQLALQLNKSAPPPEIPSPKDTEVQFQQNLQALQTLVRLTRQQGTDVCVLYTPNWTDVLPAPNFPPYKAKFFQLLQSLQIPVIDIHSVWSQLPTTTVESYFRDSVHLTVAGNRAIAEQLFPIFSQLQTSPCYSKK